MNMFFSTKKYFLILFMALMLSHSSNIFSQVDASPNQSFFEQLRYGGSLGLRFGNGFFNASLAPKAIYDFNQYVSAGIGVLGSYTSASNYNATTFGGSVLGLFRPLPSLQLSAEFEELHVSRNFEQIGSNRKESYWYPALFLGVGYITGPVTVGIRYDVLFEEGRSIYGAAFMPFVSIFF